MKSVIKGKLFSTSVPRAFHIFKQSTGEDPYPNISSENKQKLDGLASVIKSLPNKQLQYLKLLQEEKAVKAKKSMIESQTISVGESRVSELEYVYQKQWIQETWKDIHILTALAANEKFDQGKEVVKEVVKQIYEFELTSVDPAQKIKVIKVLREILNLGLKQAKDMADKAPMVIKKGKREEGEELKNKLTPVGCVITLK